MSRVDLVIRFVSNKTKKKPRGFFTNTMNNLILPPKNETCDVIFLVNTADHETFQMTIEALISLRNSEPNHKFNVILVESGQNCKFRYEVPHYVEYEGDFNYNRALNMAFEKITSNWVAVFNNDVIFHPNWYTTLRYYMELFNLDSASPRCPKDQFGIKPEANQFITGLPEHVVHVNGGTVTCFAGWGWVMKSNVLKMLLPLSEDMKFWFQDDDINLSLKKLNKKHGMVSSSHVTHFGQKSYKHIDHKKLSEMTTEVQKSFMKKWSS
jgi:hypothetical protein